MATKTYITVAQPNLDELEQFLTTITNKIMLHNPEIGNFLRDIRYSGSRFQEIYDFSHIILKNDDIIRFKTEKGSNDRDIPITVFSNYYLFLIDQGAKFYFSTSLNNFYTVFNRYCWPYKIFHHKKELAAHAYRHLYAKELFHKGWTREGIRVNMGEVNINNSNNYIDSEIEIKQVQYKG